MTDRNQLCREFTELTGGHWHEWEKRRGSFRNIYGEWQQSKNTGYYCSVCGKRKKERHCINHTYTNPADVLKKIIEIGLYDEFMVQYGGLSKFGRHLDCILVDLILEPDALLKAAVEFLKEGEK